MLPYTLIPETLSCLERIETLRAQLDRQGPLPRIWLGRTRRDLEVEAVAASTRMEGVPVTVEEARRILAGDPPQAVSAEDAALVEGYREAMRYVLARADDPHFAWHSELILAIHHHVLAGSHAAGAGRYRDRQNWLSSAESGEQIYLPPPAEAVPGLMQRLLHWLTGFDGPAPVAAAMAHVGLAAIHPFQDGNGRTARILASLVMLRGGYRAPQFTSLEEWWGRHMPDYYGAFACLGDRWNPDAEVTDFLRTHACAQASQASALALRGGIDRALWTLLADHCVHDLGLELRTTHALYDAVFAREISNRYYRSLAEVSAVTASHDLGKLVAAGLLQQRGAGRSSHYIASERLMRELAAMAGLDARILSPGSTLKEQRDAILLALSQRLHAAPDARDG